jgi:hypothetical protein
LASIGAEGIFLFLVGDNHVPLRLLFPKWNLYRVGSSSTGYRTGYYGECERGEASYGTYAHMM